MAVNHELAAKYNGMQLRDTTELNQATKVTTIEVCNFRSLKYQKQVKQTRLQNVPCISHLNRKTIVFTFRIYKDIE